VAVVAIEMARTRKNEQFISVALATATCTLLGSGLPTPVDAQEEPSWNINTAAFYYGEDGGRVQDFSIKAIAERMFVDDRVLTLGLAIDALTGATPSGAIRLDVPQTLTQPSGNATKTVPAGEYPLDDTFRDIRVALTVNWQQPFGDTNLFNVGASLSKEYDYLHVGLNAKVARNFNKRNTTLSAGIAIARDQIDPEGGIPTPFSSMLDVGDLSNRLGTDSKDILDVVVGVSQVVSRNLVVQANYSYSYSDGYLNDPYRILSIGDSVSGDTIPRTPPPGVEGPSHEYIFESRPVERTKHSFYTQAKYYMNGKVLDASYRYMTDDWNIDSHTVNLRYRWPLGASKFLEPHLRLYSQNEAEFYRLSLVDGAALPAHASTDYRLGNFDAITLGAKYGWKTRSDNDMSIRVEWYQQSGSVPANLIIGNQAGRNNYPDLNALIVQFSYRFSR